jgi:hypothetical protein
MNFCNPLGHTLGSAHKTMRATDTLHMPGILLICVTQRSLAREADRIVRLLEARIHSTRWSNTKHSPS